MATISTIDVHGLRLRTSSTATVNVALSHDFVRKQFLTRGRPSCIEFFYRSASVLREVFFPVVEFPPTLSTSTAVLINTTRG